MFSTETSRKETGCELDEDAEVAVWSPEERRNQN